MYCSIVVLCELREEPIDRLEIFEMTVDRISGTDAQNFRALIIMIKSSV